MIPELGHFALALALAFALVQSAAPWVGLARSDASWSAIGRHAAQTQSVLVWLALAALILAFVRNDFSVGAVAQHSNSLLPLGYRIAGTWGGHEGSMLLWLAILAGWTLAIDRCSRSLPASFVAQVLGVLGVVSAGLLSFVLFTSNPFERNLSPPPDGRDLNPLLQDIGMIAHPPLLYMGYVGTSVAFAFAVAALIGGRMDTQWTRWTRPWTLAAWSFLTAGILLGSFWAYYELGWGGWWFWDAVENASFMPWLLGTALIHSQSVTEKRGTFKNWTVLLALLTFSTSLLGTFLVRSGVITSVHAFATDPQRGVWLLVLLGTVVGASLTLYVWRGSALELTARAPGRFELLSRESLLLLNNVLLTVIASTVMLGTLYPLLNDALGGDRISVGPPYFESVFVPLVVPLLWLLGLGPWVAWKRASLREVLQRLSISAVLTAGLGAAWAGVLRPSAAAILGVTTGLWVILATLAHLQRLCLSPGSEAMRVGLIGPLRRLSGSTWGMVLSHLGIGVFVLGVTLVKSGETVHDLSFRVGDEALAGGYSLRLARTESAPGPNYTAIRGVFEVRSPGEATRELWPEKRTYTVQRMPMTEAAIDRGFTRDLYLSMGEHTAKDQWVVRFQIKPFMSWLWIGVLLMVIGGAAAALDRRFRKVRDSSTENESHALHF